MKEKVPPSFLRPSFARQQSSPELLLAQARRGGFKNLSPFFQVGQNVRSLYVLEAIARILKIKVIKKKTYFTVKATGSNEIEFIVKYYFKTMKGMKALEYRIWARSFSKDKKDFEYMTKIQNLMRNIRSIRLDKNFKLRCL